jgi:hypothetical protein
MGAITPVHQPQWINVERPSAFTLAIPEAASVPASCAIWCQAEGSGPKNIVP